MCERKQLHIKKDGDIILGKNIDKSKRATLNVTLGFKEDLDKMRLANESYEEILRREIGGFNGRLINVREPIAFELKGEYTDEKDEYKKVFWSDLQKCQVGDFWSVSEGESCIHRDTASVIYRDEDVVLIKFKTMIRQRGIPFYDVEIVSYNFLSNF